MISMKKLFLSLALMIGVFALNAQTIKLEKLWETTNLATPESVLFDKKSKNLLVSLIDGNGMEKDGKGGVAILNTDGSVKDGTWVRGLNAPKGMAVHKNTLYVADITDLVLIDMSSGKVIQKIAVDGAVFLNDVAVDKKGTVYVSDTRTNAIYKYKKGKVRLYKDNVPSVNGLKVVKDQLLALAGPELWQFDKNKNVKVLTKGFELGGDGLEPIGKGDYLVTCWGGLIYYVKSDGTFEKIQDVQGKMNTADLGLNRQEKIIYIPTFNNNSVIAYQLK